MSQSSVSLQRPVMKCGSKHHVDADQEANPFLWQETKRIGVYCALSEIAKHPRIMPYGAAVHRSLEGFVHWLYNHCMA